MVRKRIRCELKEYETKRIRDILQSSGSTRRINKELSDLKRKWILKLRTDSGKITTNREEIRISMNKFFESLYHHNPSPHCYQHELQEIGRFKESILEDEVTKALNKLKKGKAPGPDDITNDVLILGKNCLAKPLMQLFNRMLQEGFIPQQWYTSKIILLYKKGDAKDIENYRPITLSSSLYKVFATIIKNRLLPVIYENHPYEQAGFRPQFSTIEHLHTINQILEKSNEYNIPLYLVFIDFRKAFDSVYHSKLWQALQEQGINTIYINILKTIYEQSKAYIVIDGNKTTFEVRRGVKQGCPLSPILFNCLLNYAFNKLNWEEKGININGYKLTNLRFADDIVIFANSLTEMKQMINELLDQCELVGLSININKTKIMTNSRKEEIKINNQEINFVDQYNYLGQSISFNDRKDEINKRINLGWKKYWSLKHIFKSQLSSELKAKVLEACIYPVILYGSQTWSATETYYKKLTRTEMQLSRSMIGIKRKERISNRTVKSKIAVKSIIKVAKQLKWRWAGHVARLDTKRWSKIATEWIPRDHKRRKGRPVTRWRDEIVQRVGDCWASVARNREVWSNVIKNSL